MWKASELQQALNPVIDKLWALDPEASPFRSPVDPDALGIPVSVVGIVATRFMFSTVAAVIIIIIRVVTGLEKAHLAIKHLHRAHCHD